ncbi:hypothetical protein METBIDRAFT_46846 [Metschnikowia bicuspidata var. bicuspidata NRRL YB-4993]|uniref:Uncharacterized protein n=1 Tax=Metschnikowia bicuspidata var. bicuspidata NRRL YB-4993 TaxID=869754 RepID=A0A1A0H604_9ASCO|nr:hypothetical protein METBIDRAFT_46846 [Metschnikowia bicuspidata var. bicuspidata NRRL YB-4993]OBA19337.1 hypothetical protein METBIDRAFT_46846 [Metschnikowia bicuspidata var. bicuspidata NRRL YB-4993]
MESLPDLGQGPEVFETSDVESLENLSLKSEEVVTHDIEIDNEDAKSAHARFEENTLVGLFDLVDFLGSLVAENLGRNTYHTRKWTETKAQRLARIAQELREIQEEDNEDADEAEKLRKILEALVQNRGLNGYLSGKLDAVFRQVENELAHCDFPQASDAEAQKDGPEETKNILQDSKVGLGVVLDLELRINELEQAIGVHEMSQATNLALHMRDLDRKVNVLYNPEYEMDTMKTKVSELNKELETYAKTTRMAQLALPDNARASQSRELTQKIAAHSSVFEKKLDTVYEKLGEIESMKARLPAVISRLRSLHETHSDLATAVSIVGQLDDNLETLKRDLQSWNDSLDTVRTAINQHAVAFDDRLRETETKLQQMEARVEALL